MMEQPFIGGLNHLARMNGLFHWPSKGSREKIHIAELEEFEESDDMEEYDDDDDDSSFTSGTSREATTELAVGKRPAPAPNKWDVPNDSETI